MPRLARDCSCRLCVTLPAGADAVEAFLLVRKCYQGNDRGLLLCCCWCGVRVATHTRAFLDSQLRRWRLDLAGVRRGPCAAQGLEASGAAITTWPTTEERRLRGLTAPWVGFLVLVLASLGCWS